MITFRKFHFLVGNSKFLRKETVSISGIFVFRLFWLQQERSTRYVSDKTFPSPNQSSTSPESESIIQTWAASILILFKLLRTDLGAGMGIPGADSIISHFVLLPSSNSTPKSISTPTQLHLHSKSIQLLQELSWSYAL